MLVHPLFEMAHCDKAEPAYEYPDVSLNIEIFDAHVLLLISTTDSVCSESEPVEKTFIDPQTLFDTIAFESDLCAEPPELFRKLTLPLTMLFAIIRPLIVWVPEVMENVFMSPCTRLLEMSMFVPIIANIDIALL